MLAGKGVLRWPGGEERVQYKVSVGFDGIVGRIWMGPVLPYYLRHASRHGVVLYMPEGRRLALNVAANGYLSPDGVIVRSLDGQEWWMDMMPWLPVETPGRLTLALKIGPVQVFESYATPEEAEAAYQGWQAVDIAEIRPPFSRPTRLK